MEDNVRLDKNNLIASNAALVKRVVQLCDKYERQVATCRDARRMLGLSYSNDDIIDDKIVI